MLTLTKDFIFTSNQSTDKKSRDKNVQPLNELTAHETTTAPRASDSFHDIASVTNLVMIAARAESEGDASAFADAFVGFGSMITEEGHTVRGKTRIREHCQERGRVQTIAYNPVVLPNGDGNVVEGWAIVATSVCSFARVSSPDDTSSPLLHAFGQWEDTVAKKGHAYKIICRKVQRAHA